MPEEIAERQPLLAGHNVEENCKRFIQYYLLKLLQTLKPFNQLLHLFGVIAGLFRQIEGHSSRFVLF